MEGIDYQTLIDLALREHLERRPLNEETLRRVLREELHLVNQGMKKGSAQSPAPVSPGSRSSFVAL